MRMLCPRVWSRNLSRSASIPMFGFVRLSSACRVCLAAVEWDSRSPHAAPSGLFDGPPCILCQSLRRNAMRRRLYFLLPDLRSARKTMDDLLLARVENRHIHFIARPGTPMDGLHEANVLQTSDLVHAAQTGLVTGAALGCAAGGLAAYFLFRRSESANSFGRWRCAGGSIARGMVFEHGGIGTAKLATSAIRTDDRRRQTTADDRRARAQRR